jgi:PAS domain S-box-containing protein
MTKKNQRQRERGSEMSIARMPDSVPQQNAVHHSHVVQFYSDDSFLLEELRHVIGTALTGGSSAVILATRSHNESLAHRLKHDGLDLAKIATERRYQALDATQVLSQFMVDGRPDPARFAEIIGGVIARAAAASHDENRRVVAFGEMVALLWAEGRAQAAIELEKLWNELARSYSFSLRCAYPMQGFCREEHAESLLRICAEHSGVVPDESYTELTSEDERLRNVVRLQQRAQTLQSEIDWRHREERFRLFVEGVQDYAIFMLDPEGHVSTWNTGARRIKGYLASEIVGRHFSCFYPEEDIRDCKPQRLLELAAKDGHSEDEGWRVRKDGSKFWANVTISAIRDEAGNLIGFGKVTRDLTERKRAETALRRSEARFRLLTEAVQDYAIFMLDPEGHVSTWNTGAERLKGYKASEIIGRHFSCFYCQDDLRAGKPRRELEIAEKEGRFEEEGWRLRRDGSKFWASVTITALRDDTDRLVGFGKVTRDVTERMKAEKSLRALSLHLLKTQDEERRRIGRDLHDSLGQYVAAMKMSLDTLASSLEPGETETREKVAQCVHLAEECVKEVRTISHLLYPPMLEELGLKSAISWYLGGFTKRSGIQASFDISPDFGRLSRDLELALFRVLQESLANVHRHSGSQTAHVQLSIQRGMAVLEISDQGKGIPSAILEESGEDWLGAIGVGLRGMKERMRQLGGSLEISSGRDGTRVTAAIPPG